MSVTATAATNGAHGARVLSTWERMQSWALLMTVDPIEEMGQLKSEVVKRPSTVLRWVWVVLIVAVAVVAATAVVAYVATECIKRGGSYAGGLSVNMNGWKVWEYELTFKCTQ